MNNETLSPVCSDNGECECGVCQCSVVPGTTEKYYGRYCQCNNFNCEQADNKLCGGPNQGKCVCGECKCEEEFTGSNCGEVNCPYFAPRCLNTIEGGARVNCSGHGKCNCDGICQCDSFYEGRYCENCPSCAGRFGDYKICVLCKVFGEKPDNATLCDNCPAIWKYGTLANLKALNLPTTCQETDDDGCTYYYSYETRKNATFVHVVENKDCPELGTDHDHDVLTIGLAVIGGIVGIGIILLILWKLHRMVSR